ncbi:MAG: hypothetical protein V2I66_17915 [Halieaceae bacterium]|jgi:hypothetical protein|nr:hypothetical protein [Halieaceae bacterium]
MKTMLMTWFTSGAFLGAAIGLITYVIGRDVPEAVLVGAFGGFIGGAAAAALSGYVDQRMRKEESAARDTDA